eukprot:2622028-Prymnesium_polylepis.1
MPFTARRPRSCLPRRAHSHRPLRGPSERPWLDVGRKRGTQVASYYLCPSLGKKTQKKMKKVFWGPSVPSSEGGSSVSVRKLCTACPGQRHPGQRPCAVASRWRVSRHTP